MSTAKAGRGGKKQKAGVPAPDAEKALDTKGLLAKDVAGMMYGFGDDRTPFKESVDLVEEMVLEYVVDTWQKTLASAHTRGAKPTEKDVIFLLRKDQKKYDRARELLYLADEISSAKQAIKDPDVANAKLK